MYNNLELYLMMHKEMLREMGRSNQRHLQSMERRQKRRFNLRRLLFFL